MMKNANFKKSVKAQIVKKGIFFFLLSGLFTCFSSCKNDDDEFLIIDYYPVIYEIQVLNASGENLLDESTEGNILDKEIYIEAYGEKFDVSYGRPEESILPEAFRTRAYMPMWYGVFVSSYWYQYPELPDRDNRLYVGEFPGDASKEVKFKLYLDGHSYDVSYVNKKIKGMEVDRHYYLNGKEINSSTFTLTL